MTSPTLEQVEAEISRREKMAAIDAEIARREKEPDRTWFDYFGGMADSITQGALMGYGDEFIAHDAALSGRTPEGAWFDYSAPYNERYDRALAAERSEQAKFAETNPLSDMVGETAGMIGGLKGLGMGARAVTGAAAPTAATGSLAQQAAKGAVSGAGLAALYGTGIGEDGLANRLYSGATMAPFGAVAGGAAPFIARGAGIVADRLFSGDHAIARNMGISVPAMRRLRDEAVGDNAGAAGQAADRITAAGPYGMVADAGESMQGLLDEVVARGGPGSTIARQNIAQRTKETGERINQTLEGTLGPVRGVRGMTREIERDTRANRQATYDRAYATPIDYASPTGAAVEEVLGRIPPRIMNRAIQEANEDMIAAGTKNQQIMVKIADDGSISFVEMPNVQQLDYIKRALQGIARDSEDIQGKLTSEGRRAKGLAADLRDALGKAVSTYGDATAAGADRIAMDNALRLGRKLLNETTEREIVELAVKDMGDAERRYAAQGLRSAIDEKLANVKRTAADGDTAAREAWQALKNLSSRAAKEKVSLVLGDDAAEILFRELDQAATTFQLRANVATNSRTAPRTGYSGALSEEVRRGVVNRVLEGRPVATMQEAVQTVTGRTPSDYIRMEQEVRREIAKLLTTARGQEARELFEELIASQQRQSRVEEFANTILGRRFIQQLQATGGPAGEKILDTTGPQ